MIFFVFMLVLVIYDRPLIQHDSYPFAILNLSGTKLTDHNTILIRIGHCCYTTIVLKKMSAFKVSNLKIEYQLMLYSKKK